MRVDIPNDEKADEDELIIQLSLKDVDSELNKVEGEYDIVQLNQIVWSVTDENTRNGAMKGVLLLTLKYFQIHFKFISINLN